MKPLDLKLAGLPVPQQIPLKVSSLINAHVVMSGDLIKTYSFNFHLKFR